MKVKNGFKVYQLDLLFNKCDYLCKYEGEKIRKILFSEDCKSVFLIQASKGAIARHHLYSVELGESAEFHPSDDESGGGPRVEVVYSCKTVSSSLIIVFEEYGQTKVGILNDGVWRDYADKFQNAQNAQDYSLLNSGNVLMMKSIEAYSFECLIIKKNSKKVENSTYIVREFTGQKYKYPYFCFIKGGIEVFRFDFFRNRITYLKLNAPLAAPT